MNFDKRHNARELPSLIPKQLVWVIERKIYGRVLNKVGQRRYVIPTEKENTIRRNLICQLIHRLLHPPRKRHASHAGVLASCESLHICQIIYESETIIMSTTRTLRTK